MSVPAVVLCGERAVSPPGVRVASLAERFGTQAALEGAGRLLEELAAEVAAEVARELAQSGERSRVEGG
jgi:hypothetical protein